MLRNALAESTSREECLKFNSEFWALYYRGRETHPLPEGWSENKVENVEHCSVDVKKQFFTDGEYSVDLWGGDPDDWTRAYVERNDKGLLTEEEGQRVSDQLFWKELAPEVQFLDYGPLEHQTIKLYWNRATTNPNPE